MLEPRTRRNPHLDQRGLITGLILKAVIPFVVIGLIGYDGAQVMLAQVRAQSVSRAAASAGADTFFRTKQVGPAENDARAAAAQEDATTVVTKVEILSDGTCRVTVTEKAKTLLLQHIGFLKKYGVQLASDEEIRTP